MRNIIMNCNCASKCLYSTDYTEPNLCFRLDGSLQPQRRALAEPQIESPLVESILEKAWYPKEIPRLSWLDTNSHNLYRHYISKNIPCILTDVLEGDAMYENWAQPQYVAQALAHAPISIALTPDGYADSVKGNHFVQPCSVKASFSRFLNHAEYYPFAVPYIQQQDGNLTKEFTALEMPNELTVELSKAVGSQPEAANIWVGYDESVSSLHKDPFENFYLPIVGEKHFTLTPPSSILLLEEQKCVGAEWKYEENQFRCESGKEETRWVIDNLDLAGDIERRPCLKQLQKYHVVVKQNEMLYLPSLWYHQVAQCRKKEPYTLAVNYWFDMDFTHNYALYSICRDIKGI